MSEPGRKEISARDEHKALAEMLKERYDHQEGGKETAQKVCALCGEHRPRVYELSKDLVICKKCRDSGVSSMSEAAGLLYLAYGNFRRRFPSVLFRYPDLLISQQSMYDIISANPIVANIHRDVEDTDFLKIRNSESDKFTIEIVRDIPYFFLEELYVRVFAWTFGKSEDNQKPEDGVPEETWILRTKEYLKGVGREWQANLL